MTAMLAMPRLPPKRMRLGENEKGEPSTVLAADTNLIVSLDYKWDLENYKSGKLPIRSIRNLQRSRDPTMSVYSGWWFGMMIQPDELIFFRGVETTNQPIINGMQIWDFITISSTVMAIHEL